MIIYSQPVNLPSMPFLPTNIDRDDDSPELNCTLCYCGIGRRLGQLELNCSGCKRWIHKTCFRNLKLDGLPFMVSYVFICKDCSQERREKWSLKTTNFSHMCIMALANLAFRSEDGSTNHASKQKQYFNVERDIIPFFEQQWENLTSMHRRVKNTWHGTILRTLAKEVDLFDANPNDPNSFALKEQNLLNIGPMHESVVQLYKKATISLHSSFNDRQESPSFESGESGPKTRGSARAKTIENDRISKRIAEPSPIIAQPSKKMKNVSDRESPSISNGNAIDYPFNREGYRYYLVEWDPTRKVRANREDTVDSEDPIPSTRVIPGSLCRLVIPSCVTLSPNDRANQLILSDDYLTVAGFEGYSVARGTHPVSHDTWYFEVKFLSQPDEAHIRIGWAQTPAVLQACLGYSKFSYSWRSKKGTIFHDARGRHYMNKSYKQGDLLGCLIQLPSIDSIVSQGFSYSDVLPSSKKNCDVIRFRHRMFFEEKNDDLTNALKELKPLIGSKIEFFLNGESCGTAFTDIYFGTYYPAISIYRSAKIRCNFGPVFEYPPKLDSDSPGQIRPMSDRVEELCLEQTLSDMSYMIENEADIRKREEAYYSSQ